MNAKCNVQGLTLMQDRTILIMCCGLSRVLSTLVQLQVVSCVLISGRVCEKAKGHVDVCQQETRYYSPALSLLFKIRCQTERKESTTFSAVNFGILLLM